MQDFAEVTGVILKSAPAGENDKRCEILTAERGRLSFFARGARRQGSRFLAATEPFSFGVFRLYEGKNAYSLADAEIREYFAELRQDFSGAYYGMYFCDVALFYARENNDDKELLKLLYAALRALTKGEIPFRLIRAVYELKAIAVNGEFAGVRSGDGLAGTLSDTAVYTVNHIVETPPARLFHFLLNDEVFAEVRTVAARACKYAFEGRRFKSLELLDMLAEPDS